MKKDDKDKVVFSKVINGKLIEITQKEVDEAFDDRIPEIEREMIDIALGNLIPTTERQKALKKQIDEIRKSGRMLDIPGDVW